MSSKGDKILFQAADDSWALLMAAELQSLAVEGFNALCTHSQPNERTHEALLVGAQHVTRLVERLKALLGNEPEPDDDEPADDDEPTEAATAPPAEAVPHLEIINQEFLKLVEIIRRDRGASDGEEAAP